MSRQVLSMSKDGDSTTWAACASIQSPSQSKRLLMSRGNLLCVCFKCVLVASVSVTRYHWKNAWLHPLCVFPSRIYIHWWDLPWAFSSPGWTVLAFLAFPPRRDAPVPSSSWWPSGGLSPLGPYLSCTGEPRSGAGTPGVASPVLSRNRKISPSIYWQYFV